MPQDYVASNRKPTPGPASLPGWVWLGAGLSMGLAIAAIVYIGRPPESMPMVQTVAKPAAPAKPKIEIAPAKPSEFSFYDLLKEQSVDIPQEEAPARALNAPAANPVTPLKPTVAAENPPVAPATASGFVIVLGSFREAANADEHRATLALSGVESHVEKTTRNDGQIFYQVRTGPEKNEARARARLAQIKSNGFEGRLITLN